MCPVRDVEALALVGGDEHELEDVEGRLVALTESLAANPELAAAVTAQADGAMATSAGDGDEPTIDRAALDATPGGAGFLAALDDFLERHGHLGQNHDDLGTPSWAEAPALFLASLVQRLGGPRADPTARLAELRRVADERAAAVRAALADRPEELARFEQTLAQAREIGYLTEGHNYWIDRMAQARLRTLAMRVGRRLAREGVLERQGDVLFLGRDEIADAIVDGRPRHDVVRERRAALAHQRTITPPRFVGVIPTDPPTGDRFDSGPVDQADANALRGTGASAGVVRGPARVVMSVDDFGRVAPGDVIVCPASNPSWVPVFTIAGGLVTNTGGVLSHAAVVAREFGLPAVVGATGATERITDGRLVEIDGTAGTVRLL
jgi:pyruvate,water dikinase